MESHFNSNIQISLTFKKKFIFSLHRPTVAQVSEMQSDLTFKERQLKASQSTQERLEAELNKRKAELEKIDQLDKKIALELENLTNKMGSMKDQMEIFKNVCLQN